MTPLRLPPLANPNEMTSVAPRWPRYFRLISAMDVTPTNATEIIASRTPSAFSAARTADLTRALETPTLCTLDETATAGWRLDRAVVRRARVRLPNLPRTP